MNGRTASGGGGDYDDEFSVEAGGSGGEKKQSAYGKKIAELKAAQLTFPNLIGASIWPVYVADGIKTNTYIFTNSPLSVLSTFLGLPNRQLNPDKGQSWLNIGKNFIGYRENRSFWRNLLGFVLMTPLNIVTTPFKFALNIVKIVSEVIPNFLHFGFQQLRYALQLQLLYAFGDPVLEKNMAKRFLKRATLASLNLLLLPELVLVLAKTGLALITSPINTMTAAWDRLGNSDNPPPTPIKVFLMLVMAAFAFGVYSLVAPLVLGPLLSAAAPYLATHLPAVLVNAFNIVANALSPVLNTIGTALISGVKIAPLAAALSNAPALMAVTTLLGSFAITVGVAISHAVEAFRYYWHRKPEAKAKYIRIDDDNDADDEDGLFIHSTYARVGRAPAPAAAAARAPAAAPASGWRDSWSQASLAASAAASVSPGAGTLYFPGNPAAGASPADEHYRPGAPGFGLAVSEQ